MKKIRLFQVDAFAEELFSGNPAAVCMLEKQIGEDLMQKIAEENKLSETAFVLKVNGRYQIRWFTPEAEVKLCGHATLASAFVLFKYYEKDAVVLEFDTLHRGVLSVEKKHDMFELDFPSDKMQELEPPAELVRAIGQRPSECLKGATDYMFVFGNESTIKEITPDYELIKKSGARGLIITAPGEEVDFVSRFFAPAVGINEDPVTGSAHTSLIPYWADKLGRNKLDAKQLSRRGGILKCRHDGDRVKIGGAARLYLKGEILV